MSLDEGRKPYSMFWQKCKKQLNIHHGSSPSPKYCTINGYRYALKLNDLLLSLFGLTVTSWVYNTYLQSQLWFTTKYHCVLKRSRRISQVNRQTTTTTMLTTAKIRPEPLSATWGHVGQWYGLSLTNRHQYTVTLCVNIFSNVLAV
jgi:hypothetical protein